MPTTHEEIEACAPAGSPSASLGSRTSIIDARSNTRGSFRYTGVEFFTFLGWVIGSEYCTLESARFIFVAYSRFGYLIAGSSLPTDHQSWCHGAPQCAC